MTVSRAFAERLRVHSEHRGRHARLGWNEGGLGEPEAWEAEELPGDLIEAVRGTSWVPDPTIEFRSTQHINLQEARATNDFLRKVVEHSLESETVVCGSDSTVRDRRMGKRPIFVRPAKCHLEKLFGVEDPRKKDPVALQVGLGR